MVASAPRRVAIVDDDAWMRRGRAGWLQEADAITVVASLSPDEALAYEDWDRCDVALVDAWDERERFDRFPGIGVVERIRALRSREETLILVISGHVLDEMLRLRMAEAGADFFYGSSEVPDLETLVEVITNPSEARRVRVDPDRLADVGLSPEIRPNAALQDIRERGIEDAFVPGAPQHQVNLSRRGIINARHRIAALARLPAPGPSGATRHLSVPEWRAVVRFVNWARGVESPLEPKAHGGASSTDPREAPGG